MTPCKELEWVNGSGFELKVLNSVGLGNMVPGEFRALKPVRLKRIIYAIKPALPAQSPHFFDTSKYPWLWTVLTRY
jgi:hypothetical protein